MKTLKQGDKIKGCYGAKIEIGNPFSTRMWMAKTAEEWCKSRGIPTTPDNIIAAIVALVRDAMHILIAYQANQKTLADVQLSTRVMAYVLGFKTAAGADTIADLARQFGVQKQTPNKCKRNFRSKLGMPTDDGKRDDEACENMTKARKKQLAA